MPDNKKRSLTEVQPRPSSLGCNASSKPQHSQKPLCIAANISPPRISPTRYTSPSQTDSFVSLLFAQSPVEDLNQTNHLPWSVRLDSHGHLQHGQQSHVGGRPGDSIQGLLLSPSLYFFIFWHLTDVIPIAAPRNPESQRQRPMRRLWSAIAAMGVAQVRRLHLPQLCRRTPRIGRPYQFRAQYHDGCVQGYGD